MISFYYYATPLVSFPFRVGRFAPSYSFTHDKNIFTPTLSSQNISKKTKHFVYVLIETRTIEKTSFQKPLSKTHSTNTSLNHFLKQNFVHVLIEMRTIIKIFSKYFQSPHHKHIVKVKVSDLVSN